MWIISMPELISLPSIRTVSSVVPWPWKKWRISIPDDWELDGEKKSDGFLDLRNDLDPGSYAVHVADSLLKPPVLPVRIEKVLPIR